MIDPADSQTQPLALDEPKPAKRRGRPSTGQALSNAERQRRYRENLKAQRNEKMHQGVAEDLRAELAKAMERIEELEKELEAAKRKRRHRDEPAAPLKEWAVYGKKSPRAKNWVRITPKGEEYATEADAINGIAEAPSMGEKAVYTAFKVTLR
ncbi:MULTISPECIES: hypothetical protein [unclassified Pseudomonas]|uniref:hypothetical protein n=1 Tax=unclassified Pseudomonas TaxID=196821 RepID=UPI002448EAF9|nr:MULTISPECIES: hypothetical protein [unclassified Pseudomonas]MDH0897710.1 hypothetical protein [Pseudomonas sp. GD03875]MDH1067858.1 hypothetical protein [Pseudomonas sp. GD03985]